MKIFGYRITISEEYADNLTGIFIVLLCIIWFGGLLSGVILFLGAPALLEWHIYGVLSWSILLCVAIASFIRYTLKNITIEKAKRDGQESNHENIRV